MKTLFLFLASLITLAAFGDDKKISDLGNVSSLQSTDLLLIERPGDHNYNISDSQFSAAFDAAGSATVATNGYPWGPLYDHAGSATASTNGWPWGALYDAAGAAATVQTFASGASNSVLLQATNFATTATNNFRDGLKLTNLLHSSTVSGVSGVSVALSQNADGSTNFGLTVTAGGSGTVTSVDVAKAGHSSSGAVTGAGTITLTRNATEGFLGFGANGIGFLSVTGAVSANSATLTNGFIIDQWQVGFTNPANHSLLFSNTVYGGYYSLTTNGIFSIDGVPLINGTGLLASQFVITDGGTNLQSTLNAQSVGLTNTIPWTHEGTTTNITATFNGTIQSFTCTNGPSLGTNYFFHYAGANGSVSYRFAGAMAYNTLAFDYQPKWLAGSNSVITNGVLTLTSYGGTNATQLEAAMRENQ